MHIDACIHILPLDVTELCNFNFQGHQRLLEVIRGPWCTNLTKKHLGMHLFECTLICQMQTKIASVMSTFKVFKGHWRSLQITWGQTYIIGCQTITVTPRDAIFDMYTNMTFIIGSCYMSVATEFIKDHQKTKLRDHCR